MKKYLLIVLSLILLSESFAFSVIKTPVMEAEKIFIYVKDTKLSLLAISKISIKEYQKLTGQHLNFFERLSFKATQKKLKKNINADGTVNSKMLGKNLFGGDSETPFNIGGFLLGLILFLPGVLIAYLIGGDEDVRHSRVKWAWFGAGICIAIALAISKLVIL